MCCESWSFPRAPIALAGDSSWVCSRRHAAMVGAHVGPGAQLTHLDSFVGGSMWRQHRTALVVGRSEGGPAGQCPQVDGGSYFLGCLKACWQVSVRLVGVGGGPGWTGCCRKALWSQACCVLPVFRRRTMPGTGAAWRWQNWAEEACCSLLGSQMVSTAHTCSALSGLFVACWGASSDAMSPVWPAVSTPHASALTH